MQGNVSAGNVNYIITNQAASSGGSEGAFQSSKSSFYLSTAYGGGFTLSFLTLSVEQEAVNTNFNVFDRPRRKSNPGRLFYLQMFNPLHYRCKGCGYVAHLEIRVEVRSSILWPVDSNAMLPTARHRCHISLEVCRFSPITQLKSIMNA